MVNENRQSYQKQQIPESAHFWLIWFYQKKPKWHALNIGVTNITQGFKHEQ